MPNIAAVLKEEIARVARREVKIETEKLKKASAQYRSQIADLKRQVITVQKEVARLSKNDPSASAPTAATESSTENIRWSAARFKRQRDRLGLSAEKCGTLFSVSGQTIYNWESGNIRPGKEHLLKLPQFRKLTKLHAQAIIGAGDEK